MRNLFLSLSTLVSLAACQNSVHIASKTARIINGSPDLEHPFVGGLTDTIGDSFCTGTYVGNKTIVTAAHCFEGGGAPSFIYFGQDVGIDADACNNGDDSVCARFVSVDRSASGPHPDFDPDLLSNDIGIVKLEEEPAGIAPSPFIQVDDGTGLSASDEGQPVVFAGFGVTDGAAQTDGNSLLKVDGILGLLGPDLDIISGGIDNSQVFYDQANGGPCNGDSGGPMFIKRNGQDFLAGVTSFGDADCVEFGVSTRVDIFTDFINGDILPASADSVGGCDISAGASSIPAIVLMVFFVLLAARRRRS